LFGKIERADFIEPTKGKPSRKNRVYPLASRGHTILSLSYNFEIVVNEDVQKAEKSSDISKF